MRQIQGFVEIFFALFFWLERDEYINVDVRKTVPASENELENKDINNRLSNVSSLLIIAPLKGDSVENSIHV